MSHLVSPPPMRTDSLNFRSIPKKHGSQGSLSTLVEPDTPSTLCDHFVDSSLRPPTICGPDGRKIRRLPQPPSTCSSSSTMNNCRPLPHPPAAKCNDPKQSLSLLTDVVRNDSLDPPTPQMPMPPSPATALKKRTSKLRRHFGERPPSGLVGSIQRSSEDTIVLPSLTPNKCRSSLSWSSKLSPTQAAEIAQLLAKFDSHELNASDSDDDNDSDYSDTDVEDLEDSEDFTISVVRGVAYRASDIRRISRRWSRKWTREAGGKAWEPQNFDEIIGALRKL